MGGKKTKTLNSGLTSKAELFMFICLVETIVSSSYSNNQIEIRQIYIRDRTFHCKNTEVFLDETQLSSHTTVENKLANNGERELGSWHTYCFSSATYRKSLLHLKDRCSGMNRKFKKRVRRGEKRRGLSWKVREQMKGSEDEKSGSVW